MTKLDRDESSAPLLRRSSEEEDEEEELDYRESIELPPPCDPLEADENAVVDDEGPYSMASSKTLTNGLSVQSSDTRAELSMDDAAKVIMHNSSPSSVSLSGSSSGFSTLRRSSSNGESNASSFGLSRIMEVSRLKSSGGSAYGNPFVATANAIWTGLTLATIIKGFLWSLAITNMHYVGIIALHVPEGFTTFDPFLVFISGAISWIVCLVGCILMPKMETHFSQQILFSVVAAIGVAAMHFTGT